ncbi:hypothetical protein F4604DRAFT_1938803 [Suillus subluteus]|nr:hypothetical protein F4604DRAFT_1938803 [Suillus subluteus]
MTNSISSDSMDSDDDSIMAAVRHQYDISPEDETIVVEPTSELESPENEKRGPGRPPKPKEVPPPPHNISISYTLYDSVFILGNEETKKATGGANNVACLAPKFKDMPESTFQESNTSGNVLKRKVLMLVEIDGSDDEVDSNGSDHEDTSSVEETAEDELKQMMKDWNSPIYAFYGPTPTIVDVNGRRAHVFKCSAKGCKVNVHRFLDKKDARSMGNMRKHVKICWGEEVLQAADEAKDATEVRTKIVASVL